MRVSHAEVFHPLGHLDNRIDQIPSYREQCDQRDKYHLREQPYQGTLPDLEEVVIYIGNIREDDDARCVAAVQRH